VELLRWNLYSVSIDKIWNTFASVDSVLHAGQTKLGRSKQFLKRVLWNSTRREGEEFVNYFCFAVIRDDSFHVPDSIEDFVKVLDIFESPGQPCLYVGAVPKRRQLGLLTPVAKRKAGKAGKAGKGSKGSKGSQIGSRVMTPVAKRKGGKPGKGSKSRVARESRPWRSKAKTPKSSSGSAGAGGATGSKTGSPQPKAALPTSWPAVVGRVAVGMPPPLPCPATAPCPAAGSAPRLAAGSAPAKACKWAPPPPLRKVFAAQRRT